MPARTWTSAQNVPRDDGLSDSGPAGRRRPRPGRPGLHGAARSPDACPAPRGSGRPGSGPGTAGRPPAAPRPIYRRHAHRLPGLGPQPPPRRELPCRRPRNVLRSPHRRRRRPGRPVQPRVLWAGRHRAGPFPTHTGILHHRHAGHRSGRPPPADRPVLGDDLNQLVSPHRLGPRRPRGRTQSPTGLRHYRPGRPVFTGRGPAPGRDHRSLAVERGHRGCSDPRPERGGGRFVRHDVRGRGSQECPVAPARLAARSHAGTDTGIGLPPLGHHGESWGVPGGPHAPGVRCAGRLGTAGDSDRRHHHDPGGRPGPAPARPEKDLCLHHGQPAGPPGRRLRNGRCHHRPR